MGGILHTTLKRKDKPSKSVMWISTMFLTHILSGNKNYVWIINELDY